MPRFAFEAIGPTGAMVRGSLEAPTSGAALERLIAGGQTPVSLRERSERHGLADRLAGIVVPSSLDYPLFLSELGVLLRSGLPVERALSVLVGVAPNGRQASRVRQILERVRAGEPLSQAFVQTVPEAPPYVARLISAGETSGKLADIVMRLAEALARGKALRDRLISGLTYPAVLVVAMSVVMWVVFTSVLPRLTPMFADAGASLPAGTQLLLNIEAFLISYGWLLGALLAASVVGLAYAMRRPDLRLVVDRLLLAGPLLLGLPARYEAARFCRSLEMVLDGGLSVEKALKTACDASSNTWFRSRVGKAQIAVSEGERLKTAFATAAVLPQLVQEFAAVGEETGRLGAMMGEVASILEQDVATRLDRISALIVPAATLIMGGLVAAIMAGVVSGILAVNDLAR